MEMACMEYIWKWHIQNIYGNGIYGIYMEMAYAEYFRAGTIRSVADTIHIPSPIDIFGAPCPMDILGASLSFCFSLSLISTH